MKGVSYRVGRSKSTPVRTEYLSNEGEGTLTLTQRNAYFLSPGKAVKVPYSKIISVELFSDGIQILRDGANAKPFVFMCDDAAFAAQLIQGMSQLQ
jgi:hypothetical protein